MSLLPQVKKTGVLPHHWKNFRATARNPSACFKVSMSSVMELLVDGGTDVAREGLRLAVPLLQTAGADLDDLV